MTDLTTHLQIRRVAFTEAADAIYRIRQVVFQQGQGVAPALDFDGLDGSCLQIVAYYDSEAVATARIRPVTDQAVKLERMAVLPSYQGRGIGQELMKQTIALLEDQNIGEIRLNAQTQAQGFYKKLGFEPYGEEFEEAGIPHISMRRSRQLGSG